MIARGWRIDGNSFQALFCCSVIKSCITGKAIYFYLVAPCANEPGIFYLVAVAINHNNSQTCAQEEIIRKWINIVDIFIPYDIISFYIRNIINIIPVNDVNITVAVSNKEFFTGLIKSNSADTCFA